MAEPMPRLKRVKATDAPCVLEATWIDGRVSVIDMTGVVARIKAFAPLADPRHVQICQAHRTRPCRRLVRRPGLFGIVVGSPGGRADDDDGRSVRRLAARAAPLHPRDCRSLRPVAGHDQKLSARQQDSDGRPDRLPSTGREQNRLPRPFQAAALGPPAPREDRLGRRPSVGRVPGRPCACAEDAGPASRRPRSRLGTGLLMLAAWPRRCRR